MEAVACGVTEAVIVCSRSCHHVPTEAITTCVQADRAVLGRCVDEARGVEEEKSRLEECALQVQDGGGYLASLGSLLLTTTGYLASLVSLLVTYLTNSLTY